MIDSLYALDEETRYTILGHLVDQGDKEYEQGGEGEWTTSVFNLPMGDGRDSEGEEGHATEDSGPRMDLLGHAVLTDRRTAVEMLRLGTDPYLSFGLSFSRPAGGLTLAGDGTTIKNRGQLPWGLATDVYHYVSSPKMKEQVSDEAMDAAISAMIERGVAPGYCDENGDCEFGRSRKARIKLRKATCEAELLKNKGRVLIFVYPDTTLREGRVWAFEPHANGKLCSGRTVSYYGTLSNPLLTDDQAVGTVRVTGREGGSTVYVVKSDTSKGTNNASPLPVLGWSGSSAGIWELGSLERGRGVIVDTRILWSDDESDETARSAGAKVECEDDGQIRLFGPDSIILSCPHSFSLRSMSAESDTVFQVAPQVDPDRGSQVYWYTADETEVRFAKGTYVIKTRAPRLPAVESRLKEKLVSTEPGPRLRAGESRLGVDVQEIALDEGKFGGDYAELPQEVDRTGTIEHGTPPLFGADCVEGNARVRVAVPTRERRGRLSDELPRPNDRQFHQWVERRRADGRAALAGIVQALRRGH